MEIMSEPTRQLLTATQKGYIELTTQADNLADCLQMFLDCYEQRDGKWVPIEGLNIGQAIHEAQRALAQYDRATTAKAP